MSINYRWYVARLCSAVVMATVIPAASAQSTAPRTAPQPTRSKETTADTDPALKGKTPPRNRTTPARSPFEMNPEAKWACEQPAVTLEPVWRGADSLTFNFNIRNAGTADLQIKAKGG